MGYAVYKAVTFSIDEDSKEFKESLGGSILSTARNEIAAYEKDNEIYKDLMEQAEQAEKTVTFTRRETFVKRLIGIRKLSSDIS